MPESLWLLEATGTAAAVSALMVLVTGALRRRDSAAWHSAICTLAVGSGLIAGYYVLPLRFAWPPMSGLDRFLTIVLPATLVVELIARFERVPGWAAWTLRAGLAAATPRILLHGSVYLGSSQYGWTDGQAISVMGMWSGALVCQWSLLAWLSRRRPGISMQLALCLPLLCVGLTVMMAGYIKGGAAALPFLAAILATGLAARAVYSRDDALSLSDSPAILGIAVVGLFGFLLIGRYFGRLSTPGALAMMFAPLLCWAAEIPLVRRRHPLLVGAVRLMLVAVPLVVVLILAKLKFDSDMAPLL